jgi:GDP-L-fucose synthase
MIGTFMNKLLITGGSGLVGSEFSQGVKLSSKDGDLTNFNETQKLFEKYKPNYVVHTAARVGGVGANINYAGDFFKENILINTNVLEAAKNTGVKRLVSFMSTCIFPDRVKYPLREEYLHLGEPHKSNFAYAYAKRMLDIQNRAYNKQFGIDYFSVIPTNIYGLNDNYNLQNSHVAPALIHKCYLAMKNKTNLEVWGSGKPLREFVFARDVAKICELLLKNYQGNDPVIISNSDEISIKDLVELICDIFKFQGKIIWLSDKPDGQYRKPTDTGKLKSILPCFEFTKIEDGLRETIEYFIENYESVRR